MKVFITGATGFIDGNLFHELIKQGHHVGVLVRNRSNLKFIGGLKLDSASMSPSGLPWQLDMLMNFSKEAGLANVPLFLSRHLRLHVNSDILNVLRQ